MIDIPRHKILMSPLITPFFDHGPFLPCPQQGDLGATVTRRSLYPQNSVCGDAGALAVAGTFLVAVPNEDPLYRSLGIPGCVCISGVWVGGHLLAVMKGPQTEKIVAVKLLCWPSSTFPIERLH